MPIYEYRCTQCHHTFECYQPVGEAAPNCPQCGSPSKKVYNSVGLIFKGSGFHTTDYRKTPAPDNSDRPASTADKPSGTEKPSSAEKPSGTEKPSSTEKPAAAASPASSTSGKS